MQVRTLPAILILVACSAPPPPDNGLIWQRVNAFYAEPRPEWYEWLGSFQIEDGQLYVLTNSPPLAQETCEGVAAAMVGSEYASLIVADRFGEPRATCEVPAE